MTERRVRIHGRAAGTPGAYLSRLRDSAGRWLVPRFPGQLMAEGDLTGAGVIITVIDTGVEREHPTIAQALIEEIDVTGEGPADLNGHGTIVSLLALATAPGARLRSVKAFPADGFTDQGQFLNALNSLSPQLGDPINISAGVWQPECRGDCAICTAVNRLADAGAVVFAAAGNVAGRTDCPAKAKVLSIGAWDVDNDRLVPTSGVGEFLAPVGGWTMVPVSWES